MKIVLYVFSGTGNTLKVANLFKEYLDDEVTIYQVSKKSEPPPPPSDFDMVGIGYPIHAFYAPEPITKFAKSLQKVHNKPTFIFKSSGEGLHINDCSSQKLIRILAKKGYDIMLERHIVMPYNMIYRHSNEMAKQMWIYAKAYVKCICGELKEGKKEKVKKNFLKCAFPAFVACIEQPFAHLHGTMFKVNKKKCVNCGKCVKTCPQNNIEVVKGKYKFGHKCVLCMGCSFSCPKNAISVGLFKFWKVNGSYRLEQLAKDKNIIFPLVPDRAKGIYKLYKKYYREVDAKLKAANINVYDFVDKD